MKNTVLAAAVAGAALLPDLVAADVLLSRPESYETGATLLAACKEALGAPGRQYCTGYVVAVADGMSQCPPRGIVADQLVQEVTAWLDAHPGNSPRPATTQVRAALAEAFPCR